MNPSSSKLRRLSRTSLKILLWTVALVIFFYVEEDWRGAHEWAAAKSRWEAQGETFDYERLIPSPVPAGQNLGALPLFRLEPDPADKGRSAPLALRRALRNDSPGKELAYMGIGERGKLPTLTEKNKKEIASIYTEAFKTAPPSADPLVQFDALYPFLADLRAAAQRLPACRFPQDYTSNPPFGRSVSLATSQLKLVQLLGLHAKLALIGHQPQLALDDIQTIFKLSRGLFQEPMVVSTLVACAINSLGCGLIDSGLSLHAWNDAQLADLEKSLAPLDPLSAYRLALRGEVAGFSVSTLDQLKGGQPSIKGLLTIYRGESVALYLESTGSLFCPKGWFDLNKTRLVNAELGAIAWVDPEAHRVYPDQADPIESKERQLARSWMGMAPWNFFYSISAPAVIGSAVSFAHNQAWIDEARIACALERYRLAHGTYPQDLAALSPIYLPEVPHDIVNGQPYRYRIVPDGTFLLYSVGWNLKDDGGVDASTSYSSTDPDDSPQKHGDWVWPTLK